MPFTMIPESNFRDLRPDAEDQLEAIARDFGIDLSNESYGTAFRRYLILSHASTLLGAAIDDGTVFYSQYYWFRLFSRRYCEINGQDAGLDQQAFKLIESADFDVDWAALQEIDSLVAAAT